jgi:hypothetical protein
MKTWIKVSVGLVTALITSIGAYNVFYVIPTGFQAKAAVDKLGSIETCIADAATESDINKIQTKLEDIKSLEGKGYEACRNVLQSRLLAIKTLGSGV